MKIKASRFQVPPGKKVRLKRWATDIRPLYKSEKQYKERLEDDIARD